MMRAAAILSGGLLLVWPAWLNGYPLLFVDLAAYLQQTILWRHPWDKTAGYALFLLAFHWGLTLWLPLAAQGLLTSVLLWLTQRVALGTVTPARHVALCAGLALLTAAPWFASMMMPDILSGWTVLCLFLLGSGEKRLTRAEMAFAGVLGAVSVAAHLTHLAVAFGLVAVTLLLRRQPRPALRTAAPVAAAMLFLLAANLIAFGRPTLSANGAVFLVARLQADGPAVATLRTHCPGAGWYLCDHIAALPDESDYFLWNPDSPLNRDRAGGIRGAAMLSAEAGRIVAATIRERPFDVARAMAGNAARQLVTATLGDTFEPSDLPGSVQAAIEAQFGPAERARMESGRQFQRRLEPVVAGFDRVLRPVLLLAAAAVVIVLLRRNAWRDPERIAFVLVVLAALLGNAFATGALSGVHDRYQARIVWLLPLAAALAWAPRPRRGPPATHADRQARA